MVSKIHASMITALEAMVESKIAEISGGKVDIGDISYSIRSSKPKWLKCDGKTIGSAASGATALANAGARELFSYLWNGFSNTDLPIQTSTGSASTRGASADADFDANKRMPLPDPQSRMLIVAGSGSGLTARVMGSKGGAETHQLSVSEMPQHNHSVTDPGHTHAATVRLGSSTGGLTYPAGGVADNANYGVTVNAATTGISIQNQGGNAAHNNMPPYLTIGNLFIYAGV